MSVTNVLRNGARAAAVAAASAAVLALAALPSAQANVRPAALHVTGSPVSLPANTALDPFGEAPNGSVYYGDGSSVYVIKGSSPAALVLTASGHVLAVAATGADVFVAVGKTVTEYNAGHAVVRSWRLAGSHAVTSAGLFVFGTTLWAWTDWATDESGLEYGNAYRITTSSTAVHRITTNTLIPEQEAADSAGFYYTGIAANGSTSYLVHVTPSGAVHRVAAPYPDGTPALAGGLVVYSVLRDVGTKTELTLYGYNATSLVREYTRRIAGTYVIVAGTGAGLLALTATCTGTGCAFGKVGQLRPGTGATEATLAVPGAQNLLPGPAAAVITKVSAGYELIRLAS